MLACTELLTEDVEPVNLTDLTKATQYALERQTALVHKAGSLADTTWLTRHTDQVASRAPGDRLLDTGVKRSGFDRALSDDEGVRAAPVHRGLAFGGGLGCMLGTVRTLV